MKLWMVMKYAGDNTTGIFGYRGVKQDIRKALKKLNFEELKQKMKQPGNSCIKSATIWDNYICIYVKTTEPMVPLSLE